MNNKTLSCALIVALAGTAVLVGCKKKEEAAAVTPPPAVTEPAPMEPAPMPEATAAVSVSGVTVGTSAAADKSVAAATSFKPTDVIIVSIHTTGTASNQEVAAKLTYQDGQVASEQKQALNTTDQGITNITFSNANPWPAGKYTVDVSLNGAPAGMTQSIEVK